MEEKYFVDKKYNSWQKKKGRKSIILKSEFIFPSDILLTKLSTVFYMSLKLYKAFGIFCFSIRYLLRIFISFPYFAFLDVRGLHLPNSLHLGVAVWFALDNEIWEGDLYHSGLLRTSIQSAIFLSLCCGGQPYFRKQKFLSEDDRDQNFPWTQTSTECEQEIKLVA